MNSYMIYRWLNKKSGHFAGSLDTAGTILIEKLVKFFLVQMMLKSLKPCQIFSQ